MRKLSIILILSLFCLYANAQKTLILNLANGIVHRYTIDETIKLQVVNDSIELSSKHITTRFSRNNVVSYRFVTDGESTGIEDILSDNYNITIRKSGQSIYIEGGCDKTDIRVFATNSIEVTPKIYYSEKSIRIDFSSIPEGVYIIQPLHCNNLQPFRYLNIK